MNTRVIEAVKSDIVREMNDPRSPWTFAELAVRLAVIEQAEKELRNVEHAS